MINLEIKMLRIKNISELVQTTSTFNYETTTVPNLVAGNDGSTIDQLIILSEGSAENIEDFVTTPNREGKQKRVLRTAATSKKNQAQQTCKKLSKTTRKELLPGQKKIDSFFKSCSKTNTVEKSALRRVQDTVKVTKTTGAIKRRMACTTGKGKKRSGVLNKGRKRLFEAPSDTDSVTATSCLSAMTLPKPSRKRKSMKKGYYEQDTKGSSSCDVDQCIDLCSESEEEIGVLIQEDNEGNEQKSTIISSVKMNLEVRVKSSAEPSSFHKDNGRESSQRVNSKKLVEGTLPLDRRQKEEDAQRLAKYRGDTYGKEENTCSPPDSCFEEEVIRVNDAPKVKKTPLLRNASKRKEASHSKVSLKEKLKSSLSGMHKELPECDGIKSLQSCMEQERELQHHLKASLKLQMEKTSYFTSPLRVNQNTKIKQNSTASSTKSKVAGGTNAGPRLRKPRPCPPYKVLLGTSFAVDAFQYGAIQGVTHYFLTHFHADHYVGLTRKFSLPLYVSPTTARLIRAFIPLKEEFIHEIDLNSPQKIEGVEVTAIDANHCPGAVMFIFKLPCGKCILHTGDFRASPNMESEPIFWNNNIDTIYLDTTYISNKYAFCSQDESIDEAQQLIEAFQEKHRDKKILYVCGSYLIGKERFWSSIAQKNRFIVWAEERRSKALKAIQDDNFLHLLTANKESADMHVITMGKLSYFSLVEYFEPFSSRYDVCLAIRPSGWEKNSKPQYRGKINIIGVEYSEHSSHRELQRFITYLKPKEVISTVPIAGDLMITSEVPQTWYKYTKFPCQHRNFQPSITSYMKPKKKKELGSEHSEESSKENNLPNRPSQSDGNNSNWQKTTKKSLFQDVAGDADDDWLS